MSGSRRVLRAQFVQGLLGAYRQGAFPMADPDTDEVHWYSPDPRAILPLDASFHVPRRLAQTVRSGRFQMRIDTRFTQVVRHCAVPRKREGKQDTWINEWIINAYTILHEAGHAHSIEAWLPAPHPTDHRRPDRSPQPARSAGMASSRKSGAESRGEEKGAEGATAASPAEAPHPGDRLVGGLYGVSLGGAFFAESKFSRPEQGGRDASKVCLVHLVEHLRRRGFTLLDVQLYNPHLDQFGLQLLSRDEYLARLRLAVHLEDRW